MLDRFSGHRKDLGVQKFGHLSWTPPSRETRSGELMSAGRVA